MKNVKLGLPICTLKCRICGHAWTKATPLWDRGHVLADRENKHVLIRDDVRYGLEECVDFAPILERLGYSTRETCPNCESHDVTVPFPAKVFGTKELECTELTAEDFVRSHNGAWELSDSVKDNLHSS